LCDPARTLRRSAMIMNFTWRIFVYFGDHTGETRFSSCGSFWKTVLIVFCCVNELATDPCAAVALFLQQLSSKHSVFGHPVPGF
jgi:hypothetical protein